MLTASPAAYAAPKPKGLSRARRNLRWLEMRETLGCTYLEIAALTGYSPRAVQLGVAAARTPTNGDVIASDSLFSLEDLAEWSSTPEGREFLRNTARR